MTPRPAPRLTATLGGALASLLCTFALAPLFDGLWWLRLALAATAVAAGTAVLGRALRLPVPVIVLLDTLGLLITATALCAQETSLAVLVPTGQTVDTLRSLVAAGRDDVARFAAPVPQRPGLALLVVIGVYLAVMIVDFLVVVIRRPALAGLPLLALFMLPAAVLPHGVGSVRFVVGVSGFLLLLIMDGRETVKRWGKPITVSSGSSPPGRPSGQAVGITVCAMVCAVAVPAALPSLEELALVGHGQSSGNGEGSGSTVVIQPIVSLSQQLHSPQVTQLLSVRTTSPQYLRLTALEQFDGQQFTLRALRAGREAKISNGLPRPETGTRSTTVAATISVSNELQTYYLPLPGLPSRITGLDGDWRLAAETGTVFSTQTSTAGVTYRVEASVPAPARSDLAAASMTVPPELKIDTELPATIDPRIPALARQLTRTASGPYQQALAIEKYLNSSTFTYDLEGAPTTQAGALADFLLTRKRGYCEQFASAMTVLLRTLGIPARVAIGFNEGERQPDGTYLMTNKNMHAWPEVWFASAGWIHFEPTPPVHAGITTPDYARIQDPTSQAAASATTGSTAPPSAATVPSTGTAPDSGLDTQADQPPIQVQPAGGGPLPTVLWWVLLGTGLLSILGVPALVRLVRRRHRLVAAMRDTPDDDDGATTTDARAHAAWAELTDLSADLGMPLQPNESPRASATRLIARITASARIPERMIREEEIEAARAALIRIAEAEELACYAPLTLVRSSASDERIGRDLQTVTQMLKKITPRTSRARATVAPRSVVADLGGLRGLVRTGIHPGSGHPAARRRGRKTYRDRV
ncbi:transglutaminaseTgpA domain-containing protein [Candidatus Protofrankia californiensis]|uniref:transglutaminase family protein n=1 Tax=Candidatus Protofrankia californiensis TaxID=1839754 RepID=UPI00104167FF|nr:transglutaminaseTgpA domain-containing protein [Candidatus Protofrankia californiensis]